jgi:hypothetical protein
MMDYLPAFRAARDLAESSLFNKSQRTRVVGEPKGEAGRSVPSLSLGLPFCGVRTVGLRQDVRSPRPLDTTSMPIDDRLLF